MLEMISTGRDTARGGHYSQAVRAGDFVFISGQTPRDAQRTIVGATIEEQTAVTLENVQLALDAAGASLDDVVKVNVHLADLRDASRFNQVYARYFPVTLPARTTVGSVLNEVMVEVDVVAYVPRSQKAAEAQA
ncbi:RidA family protein [Paraburkholderia sp. J12]|uniref:RidA family protein n=1 Tax=Paraburkholderia sp. J12 TaxID=2805432 RepID=UPI002ABE317B|nr:RidA family protein [Paraburkholderia sp. J12]